MSVSKAKTHILIPLLSVVLILSIGVAVYFWLNDKTHKQPNPTSGDTTQQQDDSKRQELLAQNQILLSDDNFLSQQITLLNIKLTQDITDKQNTYLLHYTDNTSELQNSNQGLKDLKSDYKALISDYQQSQKTKGAFSNALWGDTDSELKEVISHMSNDEKIGQMLMFASKGYSLTSSYKKELETIHQGGVIYMGWSISNADQLATFSKQLQSINPEIPMLLATDQEGGVVKRVYWDTTSGETQWSTLSDAQLCAQAKQRAKLLMSVGVNLNLAPVVDLTYNGNGFIDDRTISGNPQVVAQKAKQAVDCSQAIGVATALKHFPGHGATSADSHKVLPEITKSKADWLKTDAVPFKTLTESKVIMVGHLQFDSLDKSSPASQSETIVEGILRKEFGYEGVVMTDAMGQLHNSTHISVKTALKRAFNAGVDIVLYVTAPGPEVDIHKIGVDLLNAKAISEERVDASLFRILSLKRSIK